MSYKSHKSGPDRVFDHLYDPLYITSGAKDVWKENHNALYRSAPIHIYPRYGTMFTDLPRRPRNYYIQQRNPLPHFPFMGDTGNVNENKNEKKFRETSVGGRDRAKFFNIPLNNEITMNLKLDIKDDNVSYNKCFPKTPEQAFRTIGCETIYREQSAQTKPWMPDAFIEDKANETPEVIYAANIIDTDDTPGLLEAKRIERARRRRQWEKSLMQSKSCDWNVRRKILEALEWEERIAREDEIDYYQKLRFGIVEKMVNSRESKMQQNFNNEMEKRARKLQAEKERKLSNLRTNHQRTLRRLDKKFRGESTKNIVSAPEHTEHKPVQFMSYSTDFEARLEGIQSMPTMPTNLERFIRPKIDITKPKLPIKEVKKGFWTDKYLTQLYQSLKIMKKKVDRQWVANCLVDIRDEILSYVSTANPSLDTYSTELESQHVILLQKIIKGRAIQSILHEGMEANQELINQLKESFELESVWKAKSVDDWDEDSVMELLKQYLDKEFAQYAKQKKIRDLRLLAEEERQRKDDEKHPTIQDEITGYLENALTDCFETLTKSNPEQFWDISNRVTNSSWTDDMTNDMVSDVLNTLLLTEVPEELSDEYEQKQEFSEDIEETRFPARNNKPNSIVTDTVKHVIEELIPDPAKEMEDSNLIAMDTIEHLLQKVIPDPGEQVVNSIIDHVVEKVIFLDEATTSLHADNMENSEEEICSLVEDICTQTFRNLEKRFQENESSDDTD